MMSEAILRPATLDDVAAINRLIGLSGRGLCGGLYTNDQIEAAIGTAWGCDSELIRDNTYFVIEAEGELLACGGWGKRQTHFGSDTYSHRMSELLDPATDAARIRAFFVHPDHAGKGLATRLLRHAEAEARRAGFHKTELTATLTGIPFYRRHSYNDGTPVEHPLPGGHRMAFLTMGKSLENLDAS